MPEPDFIVPMCRHGNIILGCPHDDCVEQNIYLADFKKRLAEYEAGRRLEARRIVREMFGLPMESNDV